MIENPFFLNLWQGYCFINVFWYPKAHLSGPNRSNPKKSIFRHPLKTPFILKGFLKITQKLLNSQKKSWMAFMICMKFRIFWYISDPCGMIRNENMILWDLFYYKSKNCSGVTITTNLKMLKCIFLWRRKP